MATNESYSQRCRNHLTLYLPPLLTVVPTVGGVSVAGGALGPGGRGAPRAQLAGGVQGAAAAPRLQPHVRQGDLGGVWPRPRRGRAPSPAGVWDNVRAVGGGGAYCSNTVQLGYWGGSTGRGEGEWFQQIYISVQKQPYS